MKRMKTLMMMLVSLLLVSSAPAFAAFSADKAVGAAASQATGQALHQAGVATSPAVSGAVNINTADAATLTSLPGIGPKKAEAIVAHRQANGNFKNLDDLGKVKGLGPGIIGKIKDLVSF